MRDTAQDTAGLRVLVAAGGTGGHLYPALALIEALRAQAPAAEATLVTTDAAHDAALVRGYGRTDGVRVASLRIRPRGSASPAALARFAWQVFGARRAAARLIAALRPQVVVGFGGYVSAPVVIAGRAAGCRILLHEQNVAPGQANRWLALLADRVAVSCPATPRRWRGRAPRALTGNPVRAAIGAADRATARRLFGLAPERRTLLVLGGSRGAHAINGLMARIAPLWSPAERAAGQILHLAGDAEAAAVGAAYAQAGIAHHVLPFCDRMAEAYAAADLALTRAGATTMAELAVAGRPAAFVPYPHGDGHQYRNAQWWMEAGAAAVFDERTLLVPEVAAWLSGALRDGARLERMAACASALALPRAAAALAREVLSLAGRAPSAAPAPACAP